MRTATVILFLLVSGCNDKSVPLPPPQPVNLAMMGDSIILLMAPQQQSLPAPFNTAINLGVGGDDTTEIRARLSSIPPNTVSVLIEGGINNFLHGNVDAVAVDYEAMLAALPYATVTALGVIQVDETALPAGSPITNQKIADMNSKINTVCAAHANCKSAVSAQQLNMSGLTKDGVHPTADGYTALINLLK